MELSNLSSNWKALQKKLQSEKLTNGTSTKRKRVNEDAALPQTTKKAKRLSSPKQQQQSRVKKPRKDMRRPSDVQRRRSESAPQRPVAVNSDSARTLKASVSHADLKATASDSAVNEGNSNTNVAGKYIAIDCEMVGIGPAPHLTSQLARVSLVNIHGEQTYDSYVLPKLPVTDYRTHVSGITPALLAQGRPFEEVYEDVSTLLKGRILVGHAAKRDLAVLSLSHPRPMIRDTSHYKPWKDQYSNGGIPSLRLLTRSILKWESFQEGKHSSVEDARAAMMLYKSEKDGFEAEAKRRFGSAAAQPQVTQPVVENDEVAEGNGDVEGVAHKKKKKKRKKGKK